MQYLQLSPVYFPHQFPLTRQPGMAQQLLQMPSVGESFGQPNTHHSQNNHFPCGVSLHQPQPVPSAMASNISPPVPPTSHLPGELMVSLQILLPQQHYAPALLYLLAPMAIGQPNLHRLTSVPGFSTTGVSGHPFLASFVTDHNSDNEWATQHLNPGSIDYASLVGYKLSPIFKRRRRAKSSVGDNAPENVEYLCPKCSKSFQKPFNLKSHMKTHSSERPFKCLVCPKTFARSHDRKRHELLHEGVKNFRCEGFLKNGVTRWGCGKKFARSDALARHFRTETGWLCIKPLMDEAREQEQLTGRYNVDPLSSLQHQIALPPPRN